MRLDMRPLQTPTQDDILVFDLVFRCDAAAFVADAPGSPANRAAAALLRQVAADLEADDLADDGKIHDPDHNQRELGAWQFRLRDPRTWAIVP